VKVGFIGLGNQGAPIAERMRAGGAELTVWARRAAATDPFREAGAHVAATPAELAAACEVIGVCVVGDADVREVLVGDGETGLLAGVRPGAVIAIHATVAPETVIELEVLARDRGAHLLDAPVSGGPAGAKAGTMTVMVGGSAEALAIARPAFELFAETIPHLGPVGSGQVLKLLNNNLAYANAAMAVSALRIAGSLGIDVDRAAEIIRVSSGASRGLDIVSTPLLAKAAGPTSNVAKDVAHFHHLLEQRGLADAPLAQVSKTAPGVIKDFARERL
jgi:3-hydroxyisobutyrate dehydrogenase-like beta-hydroxyacid dehydrogenase